MEKHEFTNLESAYEFYYRVSNEGKPATLETIVPCKEWRVIVYS